MKYTLSQVLNHRRQWVNALKSGNYKQTRFNLCDDMGDGNISFCCLGVLCEIAKIPHVNLDGVPVLRLVGFCDEPGAPECHTFATKQAMEYVGLQTHDGSFGHYLANCSLSALNDEGVPFKAIARIIEAQPEGLFHEEIYYAQDK